MKIKDGTTVSYTQWYCVRTLAQQELFTQCNMNPMNNGYDLSTFAGQQLAATQGVEFSAELGAKIDSDKVVYELQDELPAGMSFSEGGTLSGTPTVAGEYWINISMRADNWITKVADFNVKIDSAFTIDCDVTDLHVGEEVDGYIESEIIVADNYDEINYSVKGSLPEGVALEDDHLTGVPTKAGIYPVTIVIETVKVVEEQGSGGSASSEAQKTETKVAYEYNLTLMIKD